MKNTDDNMDPISDDKDLLMDEKNILPPIEGMVEKKPRSAKKDRSSGKYSEEDFRNLPRDIQLKLAEKYWNGPVAQYDDGTFQFSYTHFGKICEDLGFRKGIVDTLIGLEKTDKSGPVKIYIEHGTRKDVVEKKFSLQRETAEKIDELFGDVFKRKISNMEKSKIVDAIIRNSFSELLEKKRTGALEVSYRQVEETRLI